MKLTDEIKQQVVNLHKSGKLRKEIAEETGISTTSITKILREFNLIPPKKERPIIPEGFENQEDFKQLIIGSLLGDGCISSSGRLTKNYYFQIAHGIKQKEYFLFKKAILDKYNLVSYSAERTYEDKRFKTSTYTEVRLKTRLLPYFTKLRQENYDSEGHKRINKSFIGDLSALGLAIWYMDDGYVTNNSCIFSSCSFTLEEQELLSNILLKKFDLHFTVGKNDNSMYLLAKDFSKFVEIVKPYIVSSMKYKLYPYSKRVLDKSDELLESCDANQQPSTPLTKCEGSETNS